MEAALPGQVPNTNLAADTATTCWAWPKTGADMAISPMRAGTARWWLPGVPRLRLCAVAMQQDALLHVLGREDPLGQLPPRVSQEETTGGVPNGHLRPRSICGRVLLHGEAAAVAVD